MATSLKSAIPELARRLDLKPAAIYERQRALVRADLLDVRPGRGPGSGVLLTPVSMATLLISLVATTSLSEADRLTKIVANLKATGDGANVKATGTARCPLTGERTFLKALAQALQSDEFSFFRIERGGADFAATIAYGEDTDSPNRFSDFGSSAKARAHRMFYVCSLHFPGNALDWKALK